MPTYNVNWHHVCRDRFTVEADTPEAALRIAEEGDPGEAHDSEVIEGLGYVVYPEDQEEVLLDTRDADDMLQLIDWRPVGEEDNPLTRLKSTFQIGPVSMHMDAIEVRQFSNDGITEGGDLIIDQMHLLTGADKPFTTLEIEGRHYVLLATPYSR